ncbi:unnamed protein product [Sphacelaria rigidula]
MTNDFHMDDLMPPKLPETSFGGVPSSVPVKGMCERTIIFGLKSSPFSTPKSTQKGAFAHTLGRTEDGKSPPIVPGESGGMRSQIPVHHDFRPGKALFRI